MQVNLNIYKDENGIFIAESPFLPGFHTYGKNETELNKNLKELSQLYVDLIKNNEIEIPNIVYIKTEFLELGKNKILCEN